MDPLKRQMFRLDRERIDLAREFKARPFGVHSPELRAALNQLRAVHPGGKLILVCTKAYREWTLGQLRGDPPRTYLFEDLVFDTSRGLSGPSSSCGGES